VKTVSATQATSAVASNKMHLANDTKRSKFINYYNPYAPMIPPLDDEKDNDDDDVDNTIIKAITTKPATLSKITSTATTDATYTKDFENTSIENESEVYKTISSLAQPPPQPPPPSSPPPPCPWKCELTNDRGYVLYSALGSFYIPMFVMLFFYWRIYRAAVRTTRAINQGFKTTKGKSLLYTYRFTYIHKHVYKLVYVCYLFIKQFIIW